MQFEAEAAVITYVVFFRGQQYGHPPVKISQEKVTSRDIRSLKLPKDANAVQFFDRAELVLGSELGTGFMGQTLKGDPTNLSPMMYFGAQAMTLEEVKEKKEQISALIKEVREADRSYHMHAYTQWADLARIMESSKNTVAVVLNYKPLYPEGTLDPDGAFHLNAGDVVIGADGQQIWPVSTAGVPQFTPAPGA